MTTEKFRARVDVLVTTLAELHEDALALADSGLGEETATTVEAAAGGVMAALRLLDLAVAACPAGGFAP
ncbi:MAG: hypothetical protein LC640_09040 [Frankia sp.]|nr:hypothetical protein [Frankia sp.]